MSGAGAGNLAAIFKIDMSGAQASMTASEIAMVKAMASVQNQVKLAAIRIKELETGTKSFSTSVSMSKATQEVVNYGQAVQKSQKEIARANLMLPAQISDIGVSLAGGQNPMLVFLQQGSQIKDMYGGIGGAAKALLAFLTPVNLAWAAGAVVVGSLGYSLYQTSMRTREFNGAMTMTGNLAGITQQRFESMVSSLAASTGETSGKVRDAMNVAAQSGVQSVSLYESVTRASLLLSRVNGKSVEENAKSFAGIEQGATKMAEKLNASYNFMTADIYKQIMALESQGRASEAAALAVDSLFSAMNGRKQFKKTRLEEFGDFLGNFFSGNTTAKLAGQLLPALDAAESAQRRMAKIASLSSNNGIGGPEPSVSSVGGKELSRLRAEQSAYESVSQENERIMSSVAANKIAEQQKVLEASRAYVDAELAIEAAKNGLSRAEANHSFDERRRIADAGYASLTLSGQKYRDAIYRIEKDRLANELDAANESVRIAGRRVTNDPIEVKQKEVAVLSAKAALPPIQSKIDKLNSEQLNGNAEAYRSVVAEIEKYRAETALMADGVRQLGAGEQWAADQTKALEKATVGLNKAQDQKARTDIAKAGKERDIAAAAVDLRNFSKTQSDAIKVIEAETAALGMGTLARQDALDAIRLYAEAEVIANKAGSDAIEVMVAADEKRRLLADARKKQFDESRTGNTGVRTALQAYVDDATNSAKIAETAITKSLGNVEDAFISFAKTGKLTISNTFSFMAEEYLRQIFRMAAASSINAGGGASGFSFAKLFSSWLGGGSGMDGSGWTGEHAGGLDYVPYDGYQATLHKGERVQRSIEANTDRNRGGDKPIDMSINGLQVGSGVNRAEMFSAISQAMGMQEQRFRRLSRQGEFST